MTHAKPLRRIRLEYTNDPWTDLRPGDEGTVRFVDDTGTLHTDWDSGGKLGLVPGVDRWTEIPSEETAAEGDPGGEYFDPAEDDDRERDERALEAHDG